LAWLHNFVITSLWKLDMWQFSRPTTVWLWDEGHRYNS